MPNLTTQKDLIDIATRALGLSLGLVYIIGLLITNVYFSKFGISDFSMLRVRYLTTGFAFLGFSLLPLMMLLVPIFSWYYLHRRYRKSSVWISLFAFLVVFGTGYSVLSFIVNEWTIFSAFNLYAINPPKIILKYEWLIYLIKWFTPVVLVFFVYAPLSAIFIACWIGRWQKLALVICIPLVLFGTGSVLTRFAGGHYSQLKPAFGGPMTTISDIVVSGALCHHLSAEVVKDGSGSEVCKLSGVKLLHETGQRIYVQQLGEDVLIFQIPLTDVRLIAEAQRSGTNK